VTKIFRAHTRVGIFRGTSVISGRTTKRSPLSRFRPEVRPEIRSQQDEATPRPRHDRINHQPMRLVKVNTRPTPARSRASAALAELWPGLGGATRQPGNNLEAGDPTNVRARAGPDDPRKSGFPDL